MEMFLTLAMAVAVVLIVFVVSAVTGWNVGNGVSAFALCIACRAYIRGVA